MGPEMPDFSSSHSADAAGLWTPPWVTGRCATKTQQAHRNTCRHQYKPTHAFTVSQKCPRKWHSALQRHGSTLHGKSVSTCPKPQKGHALWVLLKHPLVLARRGGKDKTMASVWAMQGWGGTEKDRIIWTLSPRNKCCSRDTGLGFLLNDRIQTSLEPGSCCIPSTKPGIAATFPLRPASQLPEGQKSRAPRGEGHFGGTAVVLLPLLTSCENVGKTLPFSEPRSLHLCRAGHIINSNLFLPSSPPPATQTSC